MQFLKVIVVFMGLLIVGGLIFLAYGISTGLHRSSSDTQDLQTQVVPTVKVDKSSAHWGDHTVTLENNQSIISHTLDTGRLILHIRDTLKGEQIWMVWDLAKGQRQGSITVVPSKP